jgi:ppGpp synthetase/RelA/SpoT-type nucleotidyltranferase
MILTSYDEFFQHDSVQALLPQHKRQVKLAELAVGQIYSDFTTIRASYKQKGQKFLSAIAGRTKEDDKFFKKLFRICQEKAKVQGMTDKVLRSSYTSIKDIAGFRFSCPYFDQVKSTVVAVRKELESLGYGVTFTNKGLKDEDYLKDGNENGYRSYHFYVKVPIKIDYVGTKDVFLCEVQARSELQHVWADKSHDLFYKDEAGWTKVVAPELQNLMKETSNMLNSIDAILVDLRNRV